MGKLNIHMQKSEITSLFLTLCKNPFKVELWNWNYWRKQFNIEAQATNFWIGL
jgi:hypothetical protein